ncbi:PDDEXK-like family protein [Segatella salivae]|uniref:PD-(D/E)XK nuclease family protein n=1 Tax=Segatella salivae F0493 TaxID=1395125 RepID=U2L4L1_9BACT|nr:PD-(D/E)XK nuclease family protein [Segatella salivae]ERJ99290.1 PD-(D/E)XK nuclease family protein [Segatella salivae F0493]
MPNSIKELLSQLLPLHHAEQERLKKEEEEGKCFNVFSALNMCSDEVRLHSRLLATLLNPKANHGLENEFLKSFLTALGLPEDYITHCKEQIVERLIGEVTETNGGRIDIILEDRGHAVIIENKIYAGDQPNQLLRYHNYGVKTFGENNFKLVYLTLYGSDPSPYSLGGEHFEFIKLSYEQNILKLLEKLVKTLPQKPVHSTVEDYITIIKQLTHQDMDTKYQQSIIEEAIKYDNIDVTSELLLLQKQIGDKLRSDYIIKPLKGLGFNERQDDNGALWKSLNSKRNLFIVIKTDEAYWKEAWIAVASEDKTIPLQPKLDCFTDEPTQNYPYGWSWISDNEGNNWHDIAQYPAIGKEEVLKWIKNKISEIESCFKI